MSDKRLTGSVELTKLVCVKTTRKGKDGQDVAGLFIPIDLNHLEEIVKKDDKGNVTERTGRYILNVNVVVREETDTYGQNGFIAKSLPTEIYKEKKEDKEWLNKNQPIIGNIKDWSIGRNDDVPPPVEVGEDEEVPF